MTSWRASASDEAQQDLDGLFALSIEFAEGQLRDRGEFYPYAAVVRTDGGSQMVAAAPAGPDDHPESVDVIASCVAALTSMRDRIRAAAVVSDVRLPQLGTDAIRVELEHRDGIAITIVLPYAPGAGGDVQYGQARAQGGQQRIWGPS